MIGLFRFAMADASVFLIRVWDIPTSNAPAGAFSGVGLHSLCLLRYLLSHYYGEHPAFFRADTKRNAQFTPDS